MTAKTKRYLTQFMSDEEMRTLMTFVDHVRAVAGTQQERITATTTAKAMLSSTDEKD
mgnify:CR=1 FL=1